MNPQELTNHELVIRTKQLVDAERRLTTKLLRHLVEVERRRLFAERACSSMWEFCVKVLGYSEGQAYRRISAMRLLRAVPEVETKLNDGTLNLTVASQLEGFLTSERKARKKSYSKADKEALIARLQGKSSRQAEQIFATLAPKAPSKERTKLLSADRTEIRFVADTDLVTIDQRINKGLPRVSDFGAKQTNRAKSAEAYPLRYVEHFLRGW